MPQWRQFGCRPGFGWQRCLRPGRKPIRRRGLGVERSLRQQEYRVPAAISWVCTACQRSRRYDVVRPCCGSSGVMVVPEGKFSGSSGAEPLRRRGGARSPTARSPAARSPTAGSPTAGSPTAPIACCGIARCEIAGCEMAGCGIAGCGIVGGSLGRDGFLRRQQ